MVLDEKLRAYHEWRQRRDQALVAGAEPSVVVRTAGEWAASGFGLPGGFELPPVDVLTVGAVRASMPSGRRFGTLVHSILASASLADRRRGPGRPRGGRGTRARAPSDEAAAAQALVRAALGHDLLRQAAAAAAAGRCRRETPVTFGCPDGSLIEGVVDLAYEHDGRGWSSTSRPTSRSASRGWSGTAVRWASTRRRSSARRASAHGARFFACDGSAKPVC